MGIRLSLGHVENFDDTIAAFARQLGMSGIQLHAPANLPGVDGYWSVEELQALRGRCEAAGLTIDGLENVPPAHFVKIQRGASGRDEQIDHYRTTVRNMGRAGIFLLGYNFLPTYVWRTDMCAAGRGGARITAFDLGAADRGNALAGYKLTPDDGLDAPIDAGHMWANHKYFLDAVLPVAEEAGVRLALHPDDPPVDVPLGGAARIFSTPAALAVAFDQARQSPAWGVDLCLGTVSEMGGEAAINQVIDFFGPKGRICYVHFRDVQGVAASFRECFLGEGNFDPVAVIRRLARAGFDGFLIDDHVPAMTGDAGTWGDTSAEAYCSRGRAHAIGYLQGLLHALGVGDGSEGRRG
ncbi:MAG TPA: mannonate dehydratase [Streptosporangiaceae bacterium]|nr:mannonate dehydratase [Streptosporangiaceae bacterium]